MEGRAAMEREEILKRLAPCGLDCARCAGYKDGAIAELSRDLLVRLGDYRQLARIISQYNQNFANYDSFEAILKHFSSAACGGCRQDPEGCPVPCAVKTCHKEQKVDFCGECPSFPCERQEEIPIGVRWRNMNQQIKDIGLEAYFDYQASKPRY